MITGLAAANMRGFDAGLTRPDVGHRNAGGAPIFTHPADGEIAAGSDLLFLVRANGALAPVTHQHPGTQGGGHRDPSRPRARGFVMLPRAHAQYPAGLAEAQACGGSTRSWPPVSARGI